MTSRVSLAGYVFQSTAIGGFGGASALEVPKEWPEDAEEALRLINYFVKKVPKANTEDTNNFQGPFQNYDVNTWTRKWYLRNERTLEEYMLKIHVLTTAGPGTYRGNRVYTFSNETFDNEVLKLTSKLDDVDDSKDFFVSFELNEPDGLDIMRRVFEQRQFFLEGAGADKLIV